MREGQQRRKHGVKGAAATSWPLLCIRAAWVPWPLRVWEPDLKLRRGLRWGSRGHLIHPSGWSPRPSATSAPWGEGLSPVRRPSRRPRTLQTALAQGIPGLRSVNQNTPGADASASWDFQQRLPGAGGPHACPCARTLRAHISPANPCPGARRYSHGRTHSSARERTGPGTPARAVSGAGPGAELAGPGTQGRGGSTPPLSAPPRPRSRARWVPCAAAPAVSPLSPPPPLLR